jgi:hypothetical protein
MEKYAIIDPLFQYEGKKNITIYSGTKEQFLALYQKQLNESNLIRLDGKFNNLQNNAQIYVYYNTENNNMETRIYYHKHVYSVLQHNSIPYYPIYAELN